MNTETRGPNALDILREFVTDCERPYSDSYLAAAGERPAPVDPQQVADRIVEDTGWSDLAATYLKARRLLDAPPPTPRPVSVGTVRGLIIDLPDHARVMPDWHGGAPGDSEPAVEFKSLRLLEDGCGRYLSVGVALSYPDGGEECDECGEEIPAGAGGVSDAHDPSCSLHPDNAVTPSTRPAAEDTSGV
ncbi:MAG: hypothetical protein ACJ74Q_15275 [Pyrinomonadaceae bacterium]